MTDYNIYNFFQYITSNNFVLKDKSNILRVSLFKIKKEVTLIRKNIVFFLEI